MRTADAIRLEFVAVKQFKTIENGGLLFLTPPAGTKARWLAA